MILDIAAAQAGTLCICVLLGLAAYGLGNLLAWVCGYSVRREERHLIISRRRS